MKKLYSKFLTAIYAFVLTAMLASCVASQNQGNAETETLPFASKFLGKIFMYSATGAIIDNPNWLYKIDNNAFKILMTEKLAKQGLNSPKSGKYYLYVLLVASDEEKTYTKMRYVIRDNDDQSVVYNKEFEYTAPTETIQKTSFGYKKAKTETVDALEENIKLFLVDFSQKSMADQEIASAHETPKTEASTDDMGPKPTAKE